MAAGLLQRADDTQPWHPVQFASRMLNDSEKNYSNIEREAMSVIFGCDRFRKFLLGTKFIIHNDHKPLNKLFAHNSGNPSTCSPRIQRWRLKLSQFNYEFKYSKGKNNALSDCLSRLPLPETVNILEPYELVFSIQSINNSLITCDDIKLHTNRDKDLIELMQYIKHGLPNKLNPNLSAFKNVFNNLTIMKGCIMYNNRVLIPSTLRSHILMKLHDGHPGISAMKSIVRSLVWYPGIDSDVESYVKSCSSCQLNRNKPSQNRNVEWPTPSRSWSRVHIDHFFIENKICLLVIDSLS